MNMKIILPLMVISCLIASLTFAAEVSQGKCIQYDVNQKVLVIEEYDTNISKESPYGKPTGIKNTYKLAKAKIGIKPEPGDIVRIAYVINGTERKALKVMNVTKQDLRKK
jgi:hypothetical protein